MLMAILAVGNDTRGGDSWGYYTPKKVVRGLGDIATAAVKMIREPLLFMHTRKATQGAITVENAHPFDAGTIIGAHNGMIMNHHQLNSQYKRTCAVDSMHLFHHLNDGKNLTDIYGYGAIEWVDRTDPTGINLVKLSGGELAIYGIGDGPSNVRGIVWSSDDDHVLQALQTIGVNHFSYEVKNDQVYTVKGGKLFYSSFKGMKTLSLGERTASTGYSGNTPDWRNGMQTTHFRGGWDEEDAEEFLAGVNKNNSKFPNETMAKWRQQGEELKAMLNPEELNFDMENVEYEEEFVEGKGWVRVGNRG